MTRHRANITLLGETEEDVAQAAASILQTALEQNGIVSAGLAVDRETQSPNQSANDLNFLEMVDEHVFYLSRVSTKLDKLDTLRFIPRIFRTFRSIDYSLRPVGKYFDALYRDTYLRTEEEPTEEVIDDET